MSKQTFIEQAQARVGTKAHRWTIVSLIDVGGMAAVFKAKDEQGHEVAIKIMHDQFAAMPDAVERFLRESYVANKIGHRNAVSATADAKLDDGTPFIVMELLRGHPLEAYMQGGRTLAFSQAMFVTDQVLDVLASAHDQQVIHRDIKPQNIFITTEGTAKVLDFGLAKVLDDASAAMTKDGAVMGTAAYMSPEQARGKRDLIDHQTDVFAVGAVLFRALTGRFVHDKKTAMDMLLAAMTDRAPSLASVAPDLPPALVAVVDRALAFRKEDRWPDCRSMQAALRRAYETALPATSHLQAAPRPPQPPAPRPPQPPPPRPPLPPSLRSRGAGRGMESSPPPA